MRALIFCEVRCLALGSLPESGPLLGKIVIETVGGSTCGAGSGAPSSGLPTV